MKPINLILLVVALAGAAATASGAAPDDGGKSLYARVTERARELAGEDYTAPDPNQLPGALRDLNYQQYREIRFNKDHALWRGQDLFEVEFFHPGFLYRTPVVIHQVVDGTVQTVQYDRNLFDYGDNKGLAEKVSPDLGFAGFRIHYPINSPDYKDEVVSFLGASYFRMVGRGQAYGASARGLAIDTAVQEGEEFPRFSEFWLVKPKPGDTSVTFYALLNSPSVTGAYRFVLKPRSDTRLEVEARLFARRDVQKLGVAPLTSMFLYGENRVRHFDDYRPEVHDSDGLLEHTGSGEWIWRPLTNPKQLQVSSFLDRDPQGFGLAQRDREFASYLDPQSRFSERPSLWVEPRGGDWGKGVVQLVEIPSKEETNDNVVAFWLPDKPFKAGEERTFRYELRTFGGDVAAEEMAEAVRTRIGWGAVPGAEKKPPRSQRQFVVDFQGGELSDLSGGQPVKANLSVSRGETRDVTVERLPHGSGWRVAFKVQPDVAKPVDMRMYLTLRGRRVSETWSYLWSPDAIE